jgi:hypothetical protein
LLSRYAKLGFFDKIFVGEGVKATNGSLYFDWDVDPPCFYTVVVLSRNLKFLVPLDLAATFSGGPGLHNPSLLKPGF